MASDLTELTAKLLALHCNVVQRTLLCEALEQTGDGLTPTQYFGLRFVALHPGACVRDMAKGLQVSHPAAVKLAERLQARELITRTQAEADQRRVCLRTTQDGQRLWLRVRRHHRLLLTKILEALGDERARQFADLLERFVMAAVRTKEQISQVCLYCGVEHNSACAVGHLEEVLTGEPRSEF